VLEDAVVDTLSGWEGLRSICSDVDVVHTDPTSGKTIRRFVLDGELCVLVPNDSNDSKVVSGEAAPRELVEDFKAVVSLVRRKDFTIDNPTLFLLDVIPWFAFSTKTRGTKTFGERLHDCHRVSERFAASQADPQLAVIQPLEQVVVRDIAQVEAMIGRAAEEGWEGIILRRDVPYEGKRT
jgi:DNA ligase-1